MILLLHLEYIKYPKKISGFNVIEFGNKQEELVKATGAKMLLDVWHTGGVKATIKRLKQLNNKNIDVPSIHLHYSHMFLPSSDLKLIKDSGYRGIVVNEGFCRKFDTKKIGMDKIMHAKEYHCSPEEILEKLKEYKKVL